MKFWGVGNRNCDVWMKDGKTNRYAAIYLAFKITQYYACNEY